MDCHQAYYLALLQGLSEFLPVAADSQLALMRKLFDWSAANPAFALATRIGTLAAALAYFSGTLRDIIKALRQSLAGRDGGSDARLGWALLLGSVPVGLTSLLPLDSLQTRLHPSLLLAASTLAFGLALGLAQKFGSESRDATGINWKDALAVGLCQAFAPVPGASRTALTLTGGLLRGLDRQTALRFSILLSIPATAVAGSVQFYRLALSPAPVDWWSFFLGALLAAVVALVAIDWLLKLLRAFSLLPFVVYRMAVGTVLLSVFLYNTSPNSPTQSRSELTCPSDKFATGIPSSCARTSPSSMPPSSCASSTWAASWSWRTSKPVPARSAS